MLAIQHLTKRYDDTLANDDISLELPSGEIAALLGPNGAGKSTTIKCTAGLLRHSGDITIDGFSHRSVEAKARLGYVPELPALYDLLSVEEHMEFIARAYRLKDWQARADVLLQRMELDDKRKKMGKELSKGMQQKVSICCALLPRPRVLLLDEPLVGLDPHAIKELKAMLAEERQDGCTLLLSTHILDSVQEIWDRVCIMMNGRVVSIHKRDDMVDAQETLEDIFFRITEHHTEV